MTVADFVFDAASMTLGQAGRFTIVVRKEQSLGWALVVLFHRWRGSD